MSLSPTKIQDIYKQTKIWKHFEKVTSADKQKQVIVEELINDASFILDRIIETFPTYTLHNGQHQLNILNLYSHLLGPEMELLTDLESAILILSAFYHDIGMVFKDTERNNLKDEEYFTDFLATNVRARLTVMEENGINNDIAEWYCRWSHAKRVWKYLDPIHDKLFWEDNNIRIELAEVCLSHNESTGYIIAGTIPSSYWNNSDLRFCAILLRLADVLDFDDTRTPKSTYHFLGLDDPKCKRDAASHTEWEKHFASKGFSFNDWSKDHHYTLQFQAAPKEPSIQHDILSFLDYIESELKECAAVLNSCSPKWRNFKLPDKIDRRNIISQGYTYGDFRFTLDQDQVLSLLMGESLYNEQFVCIREIIQNAIDTSRYRKYYEKNKDDNDFEPRQIDVSTWYDAEGYRWIRFDDYGMGMTFSQISKFFLKVGNSYYNSDEFKVEKLSYKKSNHDFVPISRFGIGILSCFIVADIVEVNTRSIFCGNKKDFPIRLSLKGVHNYYTMQTGKNIPAEMPCSGKNEKGYRNESGTSIAIRIKPGNDLADFDLSSELDKILFNPEVNVNMVTKGKKGKYELGIGGNDKDAFSYNLNEDELDEVDNYLEQSDYDELDPVVQFLPINLNKNFSHPNIKGLLYLITIEDAYKIAPFKLENKNFKGYIDTPLKITYYNSDTSSPGLLIGFEELTDENDDEIEFEDLNVSRFLEPLELFNGCPQLKGAFYSIVLSHNGVIIPNGYNSIRLTANYYNNDLIGYIELSDKLRPNLSVSRSSIVSIPWLLWSSLNYTIRRNFPEEYGHFKNVNFITFGKVVYSNTELNEDILLSDKNYWPTEKIFFSKTLSIQDILATENNMGIEVFKRGGDTESILKKKLIELYSVYKIKLYKTKGLWDTNYKIIKNASIRNRNSGLGKFDYPPLLFCEYENFKGLLPGKSDNSLFNIDHACSKWLIKVYSFLEKNYSNHLHILLNKTDVTLLNATIDKLRSLLPEHYRPQADLILSEKDFEVDVDALPLLE